MWPLQLVSLSFGLRQVECILRSPETVMPKHRLSSSTQPIHQRYPLETMSIQVQSLQRHLVFITPEVTLTRSHHLATPSLLIRTRSDPQHQPRAEYSRIREFIHHLHLTQPLTPQQLHGTHWVHTQVGKVEHTFHTLHARCLRDRLRDDHVGPVLLRLKLVVA